MNKKPKILFTFVEAGLGHIIPMQGISDAFARKYGDKCEIINSYIFEESKSQSVQKIGKALSNHSIRAGKNILYNRLESLSYLLSSKATLRMLDMHFKKQSREFFDEYKEINPDLICSTYYLPSHLAYLSNKEGFTNSLIATYTPDSYVYPAWDRNCDVFFVNNDEAYNQALKKGFRKEQVKKIPFVYKKSITEMELDKFEARESVGIDKDRFTILVSSGAYGSKSTIRFLKRIIWEDLEINVVFVCGKSKSMQELSKKLEIIKKQKINFYCVPFTDKMANYMRASDIMIGKSGMNTVMEATYLGCPIIINAEVNRLEEEITKFCLKEKLAIREKSSKKIIKIIKNAIKNPKELERINSGAIKYKQNNGSEEAADVLFELLKTKFLNL